MATTFNYINPKAVDRYLGKYAPIGNSYFFATLLDEVLSNLNDGYTHTTSKRRYKSDPPQISEALVGVSDKMLSHNLNRRGLHPWDLWSGLDFDIVHTCNRDKGVTTDIKPYFYYTEFSRPQHERRVVLHIVHHDICGTSWAIHLPIQILMKGWPTIPDEHVGYCHSIALLNETGKLEDEHFYVGVTKRNWLTRMAEHFNEIRNGSDKTFHRTWRQYVGRHDVLLGSELIVTNHNFDQIMGWEEEIVDKYLDAGNSLNMIPGGFKGIKFLHEHNLLGSTKNITVEDRDRAIEAWQRINPRAGIPNLLISALWKDDEYAAKIICGADGRLSIDQVRHIRKLNEEGIPVEKITELVGAKNVRQVQGVLTGEHYSRIH